jgi:hypothetical protein
MQLDDIAGRVIDERLTIGSNADRVPHVKSLGAQLIYDGVEIGNLDREVLAHVRRDRSFNQMDLLSAQVDPGTGKPEVRPVAAERAPQYVGIERHVVVHVRHVDRYMMDGEWFHRRHSCLALD